jgi:hypothetical protein
MNPVMKLAAALAVAAVCALALPMADVRAQNGGTAATFPYPKWFVSPLDETAEQLMFRLYGNEVGVARNLFVLTCRKRPKGSVTVEMMPPMSLAEKLRTTAPARTRPTAVRFYAGDSPARDRLVFESRGEYDKIAAFIGLDSEKQLMNFLRLLEREKLFVRWESAGIDYVLWVNSVYVGMFKKIFGEGLRAKQLEELSHRDVYIRCSQLWE